MIGDSGSNNLGSKLVIRLLLTLLLLIGLGQSVWAFTPGDANNDGDTTLADVIYIVNIIFRGYPFPPEGEQVDVNADCLLSLADVIYLVNYIFKPGWPGPKWIACFEQPENLGPPINSDALEESFCITYDGSRAYFASNRIPSYGGDDLYYSDWDSVTETWSTPVNLGPQINSIWNDIEPSVSSDGTRLYYQAFGRAGGLGGWDVWYSEWDSVNNQWGVPQNPGPNINSSGYEASPFIASDGLELYFTGPGGVYVTQWTGMEWSPKTYLDTMINNWHSEEGPSLTAEKDWIYIYAFGDPSMMVSYWTGLGWALRKELLPPVNPNAYSPFITPDGKKLYFTSWERQGGMGSGDIWVAKRKFQNK